MYEDSSEEFWEIKYQKDMAKINEKPQLRRQINIQQRWCENNNFVHKISTDKDLLHKGVVLNNWSMILANLAHSRHYEMKAEMVEVANNLLLSGGSTSREAILGLEEDVGFAAVCKLLTFGLILLKAPEQVLKWDSELELSEIWRQ